MHDPKAAEKVEREVQRQQVIDAVLDSHGGRPAPEVRDELVRALEAVGMSGSDAWLTAVAADLSLGNIYVVSAHTRDIALEDVDRDLPGD